MPRLLDDFAKKAISILAKAEVLDEKMRSVNQTLIDHEKRICKLEGSYELNITKIEKALLQAKAAIQSSSSSDFPSQG